MKHLTYAELGEKIAKKIGKFETDLKSTEPDVRATAERTIPKLKQAMQSLMQSNEQEKVIKEATETRNMMAMQQQGPMHQMPDGSMMPGEQHGEQMAKGGMIKRADGSYSKRGLWDNIRANRGSGKKPTKQMLAQEKKIKKKAYGGRIKKYADGGKPETKAEQIAFQDWATSQGYDTKGKGWGPASQKLWDDYSSDYADYKQAKLDTQTYLNNTPSYTGEAVGLSPKSYTMGNLSTDEQVNMNQKTSTPKRPVKFANNAFDFLQNNLNVLPMSKVEGKGPVEMYGKRPDGGSYSETWDVIRDETFDRTKNKYGLDSSRYMEPVPVPNNFSTARTDKEAQEAYDQRAKDEIALSSSRISPIKAKPFETYSREDATADFLKAGDNNKVTEPGYEPGKKPPGMLNNLYSAAQNAMVTAPFGYDYGPTDYYQSVYNPAEEQALGNLSEMEKQIAQARALAMEDTSIDTRGQRMAIEKARQRNLRSGATGPEKFALDQMANANAKDSMMRIAADKANKEAMLNSGPAKSARLAPLANAQAQLAQSRFGIGADRSGQDRYTQDAGLKTDAAMNALEMGKLSNMSKWAQMQQLMANKQGMDERSFQAMMNMYSDPAIREMYGNIG